MIEERFITTDHLLWAARNGVVITEGECGIMRPCVGVSVDGHWVDYDPEIMTWVPADAYHKHDCVAVLGQGDTAWEQLAGWLDFFIRDGWKVQAGARQNDNFFEAILHGLTTHKMVKS